MPQLQTILCDRPSHNLMPFREVAPTELERLPMQAWSFQVCSQPSPVEVLPCQKTRKRGVVLTTQGWQKLLQAGVLCNEFGERYTFEFLSEQSLLDPRTVCRIIGREIAVDKRSLKIFFSAFDLELNQDDYTTPNRSRQETKVVQLPAIAAMSSSPLPAMVSASHSSDDVTVLKQQIIEMCQRFIQLQPLNQADCITFSITDRIFMVIV